MNLTKKKCKKWKKNKLKNPKTGRTIKKNKTTYNKIKKVCKRKLLSDKKICKKWKKNKLKNPKTDRKIKKDGPTYNRLQKKCMKPDEIKLKKELRLIKKEVENTMYEKRLQILLDNKKYYSSDFIFITKPIYQVKLLEKYFKKLRTQIHPDRFGNLVIKYPEFKKYVDNGFHHVNRFYRITGNYIYIMEKNY